MKKFERQSSTSRIPTISSRAKAVTRPGLQEVRAVTERRRASNHSEDSGGASRTSQSNLQDAQGQEIFTLEETLCELQASQQKERGVAEEKIQELRQAKQSLYEEVVRVKIDRDCAVLQLEERKGRHAKEVADVKKSYEGLQIAFGILKSDKESEKSSTRMKDDASLSLKVDIMKLETQIDEQTSINEELVSDVRTLKEENRELKRINQDMVSTSSALKSSNEELVSVHEKLKVEREDLSSRNDKVVANVTALKTKSDALKADNDILGAKLIETQDLLSKAKVDSLKAALALEEENKQLSEMVAEVQSALKDVGQENQALQMDIAKLNGRKWKNDTEVPPSPPSPGPPDPLPPAPCLLPPADPPRSASAPPARLSSP